MLNGAYLSFADHPPPIRQLSVRARIETASAAASADSGCKSLSRAEEAIQSPRLGSHRRKVRPTSLRTQLVTEVTDFLLIFCLTRNSLREYRRMI